jgi:hypothetical protein
MTRCADYAQLLKTLRLEMSVEPQPDLANLLTGL